MYVLGFNDILVFVLKEYEMLRISMKNKYFFEVLLWEE